MTSSRKSALPPLPGKYRSAGAAPEEYGFRWGAFALALAFLAVGAGSLLTSTFFDDPVFSAVALGLIAVSAVSAWASRLWSDRPLDGLRRLLAELPFIVLALMLAAATLYMGFILLVVGFRIAKDDPLLAAGFVAVFGSFVWLSRRKLLSSSLYVKVGSPHLAYIVCTRLGWNMPGWNPPFDGSDRSR
ncbi:MAG: hypothetical protein AB7P33_08765 [Dehalococcoidia bacterium]